MKMSSVKVLYVLLLGALSQVNCAHEGIIDSSFLEDALDAQECYRQIRTIRGNAMLLLQFTDAGLRTPRGILTGNAVDLGNYFQCLGIDRELDDMHIQGKYCSIRVPFNQSFEFPRPQDMRGSQFNPSSLRLDNETISMIQEYNLRRGQMLASSGDFDGFEYDRSMPENPLSNTVFRLAICVPKPCTTEQAINSFFFNISAIGFEFTEDYCRLPGDKTWVPADTVAVVFFTLLGFLTLLSTCYDLTYRFVFNKDVKQMKTLYRSFSVYTNGQRLMTFSSGAGNLQCLDGIRTLAMIWVIVGHSYSTEPLLANPADAYTWVFSSRALWITAATMTVDTFFTIAGVLLTYTTAGKINQISFLKNLHWFYLNRFMRVTPMLAVAIILQTSYYNRMFDGPYWSVVTSHTQNCRDNWWSTLLHIQNFVHPTNMCVTHSWYIAIDFQLYILSPLVLFWVLSGKRHTAWMGLVGGLAAVLIASTIYSFQINLQAGTLVPSRFPEMIEYYKKYYFNTLGRGSPFFVGLVAGFILHIYRKKVIHLPWIIVIFLWASSAGILGGIFYFKYRIKQFDWDNQLVDNLMNSFMRPVYACAICWLIIACVHGYSGPVNWFLSLDVWRVPARLSYGMFLFHYPLMYTINSTALAPVYFTVGRFAFKFLSYLVLAVVYSFILTVLVDSPVTVLFKELMNSAKKKNPPVNVVKNEKSTESLKESNADKSGFFNGDPTHINGARTSLKEDILRIGDSRNVDINSSGVQNCSNVIDSDSNMIPTNVNDVVVDSDIVRIDDTGIHIISDSVPKPK